MRRQMQKTKAQLRRDDGMTLVEMLVGIGVGVVVIFAAYLAMSAALTMQTRSAARVDAASRGRAAMETITRDIRAQMCLPTNSGYTSASVPAVLWASGDAIQFYSSVTAPASTSAASPGDTQIPEMRRLEWIQTPDPQTGATLNALDTTAQPVGRIVETIWRPAQTRPPYTFPSYPNSPYRRLTIAEGVEHARTAAGVVQPIFRYYGYTVNGGVGRPSTTPLPLSNSTADIYNTAGAPSVAATSRAAIVLIDIQFNARPRQQGVTGVRTPSTTPGSRATPVVTLFNRVSVRTADPTDPGVSPLCL